MKAFWLFLILIAGSSGARAAVKPNGLFSQGAVLQQGVDVPVWGTAKDGERVAVKFQGQEVFTVAKDGRWLVTLKPLQAGGPFSMTISGDNTVEVNDLLVGEVWLCSGQSNMHFPVSHLANGREISAAANDPLLRILTIPKNSQVEPQSDLQATWTVCASSNAPAFTAVGYFFGRELRKKLNVPVGLLSASVGGTSAQMWTRASALAKGDGPPTRTNAVNQGPGCLYNGMIAPLVPYAIRGVIMYQGGGNSSEPRQYQTLFPALIKDWRAAWGSAELPFLFVQMAPFEKMTPEFREAQLIAWQRTPRTAMVVLTDCGEATNVHPQKKEPVSQRLLLAARALAYGEKIEYSGPLYESMKVEGDRVVLHFQHIGSGLVAKDGDLKGFTIAGADKKFVPAIATIEADYINVSSPKVKVPVAVRYGWANVPDVNLYNVEGLPASPFRTDIPSP